MSGPLYSFLVEVRLRAAAEEFERAALAGGVGGVEHPVLPGREGAEDLRLGRLGAGEAQVRLHRGQRVGRERRALLEREPDLVVPIEIVGRAGDEPRAEGR